MHSRRSGGVHGQKSKNGETKSVRCKDFVSCLDKLAGQLVCIYVYRITQAVQRCGR